ncbi:hypothetical protein J056_003078 [Wallemia ichthyophaga EXF-994]|uniref:Uncharacterized protein n=1 Tax=Wallemia ichthyophaga (strain EXF-994 / CBS 113033) TaxID=1299270 RepID=R9AU53_WALI9|nr:uncharacterized protein J056_003078 [Wallemia ichthyophaga EXF-994]EOR03621.1 hypothetical protein J056_003078 [Wallemia ichthyophaga EXF-994]
MEIEELISSFKESHVGQHELDIQAIRKQLIQTMCPNNSSSNNNNSTPLSTPKLKSSQLSNSSNGGGVERRGSIMLEDSYDGGSLLFASNPSASKPVSTSASSGS